MVAFAGRKYAARSPPILVADDSHTITSFTLVSLLTIVNAFLFLFFSLPFWKEY